MTGDVKIVPNPYDRDGFMFSRGDKVVAVWRDYRHWRVAVQVPYKLEQWLCRTEIGAQLKALELLGVDDQL